MYIYIYITFLCIEVEFSFIHAAMLRALKAGGAAVGPFSP